MVFGWLRNRLHGRDEEYDEIKEHILSEPTLDGPGPMFARPLENKPYENPEPFAERPSMTPPPRREEFRTPPEPIGLRDEFSPSEREPIGLPRAGRVEIDRLEDTLMFIKEQLTAIKAQNETINEKLKNIERTLGAGRY